MPINRRRVLAAGGLGALATIAKPFGIAPSGASAAATALAAASTSWTGTKKIAFFLTPTRIDPVRSDWAEEIDRRINFDISSGQDLSLQAFLRANSYGRARIEGHVRGMEVFPPGDIPAGSGKNPPAPDRHGLTSPDGRLVSSMWQPSTHGEPDTHPFPVPAERPRCDWPPRISRRTSDSELVLISRCGDGGGHER